MGKAEKSNHGKVPKITEAEYAAYVNRLKELSEENEPCINAKTSIEESKNSVK